MRKLLRPKLLNFSCINLRFRSLLGPEIFLVAILIISSINIFHGNANNPGQTDIKNSTYKIREVNSSFFDDYEGNPDFIYVKDAKSLFEDTWLGRLWSKIKGLFNNLHFNFERPVTKFIFILLFLAAIILLLVKTKFQQLFYTGQNLEELSYYDLDMDQSPIDLDKNIEQEILNKNYRNAIRYHYIKLIKILDIKNLIKYAKGKTNRDYYNEISNIDLKSVFTILTSVYNEIWYGNKMIDKTVFEKYALQFNQAYNIVNE